MNPADFVNLGVRLAAHNSEAEIRTAVNRLYYGVFHMACDLLRDRCGVALPKHQAHVKVTMCLSRSSSDSACEAGRLLNTLRELRRISDYELGDSRPANHRWARRPVELAQQIHSELSKWAAEAPFAESAAGIRDYARDVLRLPLREL